MNLLHGILQSLGLDLHRFPPPDILESDDAGIIQKASPYTMTSAERLHALCQATRYVCARGIPGDIVECGVWKGGSMLAAALVLMELGDQNRDLYLFDTFQGMPAPTAIDVSADGEPAADQLARADKLDQGSIWCSVPLAKVKETMTFSGYDPARIHFVPGLVEETIPSQAPEAISILRLDTDWHSSTWHELIHLFPRLSKGGVLIIDDYGHWEGARKAVDEYFGHNAPRILLNRIDSSGRMGVKTE